MDKGEKEYEGLCEVEVIQLISKKQKKYCAIFLDELEEENLETEQFKRVRKAFLDMVNAYTRGVCRVIGINLEGKDE